MKKTNSTFWREYALPFLLCFALALTLFFALRPLLKNRTLPPGVALILSPHFDDAVLSLGGFMTENKIPVVVATFFTGKPSESMQGSWDTLSGFENSDEALATRTDENARALARVGAYPLNLRYLDFQYRSTRSSSSRNEMQSDMKKDIETMLATLSGSEVLTLYAPANFGNEITHPDHQLVHDAFAAVARERTGDARFRFFYYEDFPYVARYRMSTTTPLKTFLERENGVTLRETPLTFSSSALEKKVDAIGTYSSQEKAFESLGEDIGAAAHEYARSRCKTLTPRPTGCEMVYEILHTSP